jgi:hypothetical protein
MLVQSVRGNAESYGNVERFLLPVHGQRDDRIGAPEERRGEPGHFVAQHQRDGKLWDEFAVVYCGEVNVISRATI